MNTSPETTTGWSIAISPKEIIEDAYNTIPKLKKQLDLYGLALDDVGIDVWGKGLITQFNKTAPIVLGYNIDTAKVFSLTVSFDNPKIMNSEYERLERAS